MRVLVTGSRTLTDRVALEYFLETQNETVPFSVMIAGGAVGAETIASEWANLRGIHVATVKECWAVLGSDAVVAHAKALAALAPELVIAFPADARSEGIVTQAAAVGAKVWRPELKPPFHFEMAPSQRPAHHRAPV